MQSNYHILVNHLCYSITSDKPLFNSLSVSFYTEKTGLVGRNGVGKSTLLNLVTGNLLPDSGSIALAGLVVYCPQETTIPDDSLVSDALGVTEKLLALDRILQGSTEEHDFITLHDDWLLREHIEQQLALFGLAHLGLDRPVSSLSGGEKTRLILATAFLAKPDFIILDEPTNNIDVTSRQFLYDAILKWRGGLLVVSHDRQLLNLMQQIVELTSLGLNVYGGNYDYYHEQKAIMEAANHRQLLDAEKSMSRTRSSMQTTFERHAKKKSHGKMLARTGKIDKLTAGSKRGRSERTQSRNSKMHEMLLQTAKDDLQTAKSQIEITQQISADLPGSRVPNYKLVLDIENLNFHYAGSQALLLENFNLKIVGSERVALIGNNGSGKTTLVKLILNSLQPDSGSIQLGVSRVRYLDQDASLLNPELSILDNFMQMNPEISEVDARLSLAQFLFRNVSALKQIKNLSGGEKIRALLACVLMAKEPPQLLILDEPTNHLDLYSIASIESALKKYSGAMLVISHDQKFLSNIGIQRGVYAPFSNNGQ
jgi:ATPase subunit of ABC transporter with duplicated ATPase domains